MIQKPPFYGKGLAFPVAVSPTGGLLVTEGNTDAAAVMLEYSSDRYSLREDITGGRRNHIADAIANLLMTRPGEHDTLPEYGSRLEALIPDPNNIFTKQEFETWLEEATRRWEKRCNIPVPEGVQWGDTPELTDQNILPVKLLLQFLMTQIPGNLVAPFVTPRQARVQEYPLGEADANGHDWCSRYHGMEAYQSGGERYIRHRRTSPIPKRHDDIFYEAAYGDTWLLVSHKNYGDIRFWWIVSDCYVQDAAERGEPRDDALDNTGDPEPGTLLRMPSRTRVLMEMAA